MAKEVEAHTFVEGEEIQYGGKPARVVRLMSRYILIRIGSSYASVRPTDIQVVRRHETR